MKYDDYDEISEGVRELLEDEYGSPEPDRFPDRQMHYRNAANHYGEIEEQPDYDEEAAALRYDPKTNSGVVINAYNADYATRAARKKQAPQKPVRRPEPVIREREMPKRKKHGLFWKLLLGLCILIALLIGALWLLSKQPKGLGDHREGCTSILLAGTDAEGTRTDTMMLLYLDETTKEMNLLSLPRDTYTSMDTYVPKLNSVYGIAGGGKDGMERLLDYVEQCVGYRPDGYILTDLDCFESIVNIMGGVRFDVPCDMTYSDPSQDLYIDLQAGEQKLNGKEAMWVVRYRSGYAMADLQRVQVQRDFVKAAMDQWLSYKNLWRAPAAAFVLTANTTTNLGPLELAWIAKAAKSIGTGAMRTDTLPGEPAYVGDGSYYIIWPETTANLINEHYNPYSYGVSHESIYSPYY